VVLNFGDLNKEGQSILDFSMAYELKILMGGFELFGDLNKEQQSILDYVHLF